jgi:thymidylate synthase
MNSIDKQYQKLLQDILDNGVSKSDRTGTGTISVFGRQIRHKMSDGFPLLTTKKMAWKTMVTELIWFLRGDTNIKYLVDNGCNIWNGDAYKSYAAKTSMDVDGQLTKEEFIDKIKTDDEFAKTWGELGKIYGHGWRNWNGKSDDELYEDYLEKVQESV